MRIVKEVVGFSFAPLPSRGAYSSHRPSTAGMSSKLRGDERSTGARARAGERQRPCVLCCGLAEGGEGAMVVDESTVASVVNGTAAETSAPISTISSDSLSDTLVDVAGTPGLDSVAGASADASAGAGVLESSASEISSAASDLVGSSALDAASSSATEVAAEATSSGLDGLGAAALDAAANSAASSVDPSGAAAVVDAASSVSEPLTRYDGFLSPLSNTLEKILGVVQHGLESLHVPYSYGFSIILLTVFVRTATYPLTKKQAEVSMAAMELKPTIDRIKRRFGDDKERIQRETGRLYEMTKINPLAGCLPSLASIPIFLGLYYSLGNVANEGQLENEGFFWIPSLAGPTSLAARKAGSGTAWLFPFEDGHPPIGWHDAGAYLILPVLLVAIQYGLSALITPPPDPEEEENKAVKALVKLLPLMLGWFALNVPAGLTLYYFSNVSLVSAQQIYLRKLGGATVDLGIELPEEKYSVGKRRNREAIVESDTSASQVILVDENNSPEASAQDVAGNGNGLPEEESLVTDHVMLEDAQEVVEEETKINKICKRKRLVPAPGSAIVALK